MSKNLDAIYENGCFRLIGESQPGLAEGTRVRLSIDTDGSQSEADVLSLAANVYKGLSSHEILELERILLDRSCFFF